jgi:hypothetical protein
MAELEDNLKLSPEEHSLKRTEHLKREEFLKFLRFGWNLIQSYHVHPH